MKEKYLICPVCFSLYLLDKEKEDTIMECEHCDNIDVLLLEEHLYYSSSESLEELKEDFKRSNHLDPDIKDFIINNIRTLISLMKEIETQ